jgi:hypothetical protein
MTSPKATAAERQFAWRFSVTGRAGNIGLEVGTLSLAQRMALRA